MPNRFYEFAGHRIDPLARTVSRGDQLLRFRALEFDVLMALIRCANMPVSKETLLKEIWPDVHVSEENLRKQIQAVREKLGKAATGQEYILTIPKRGYMLAVPVTITEEETAPNPPLPGAAVEPVPSATRRAGRNHRLFQHGIAAAGISALAIVGLILATRNHVEPAYVVNARLLATSTTEGAEFKRIKLQHQPEYVALSPRGDRIFSSGGYERKLSIVRTDDNSTRTISLPDPGGPLAISPDGAKLYIGSFVEGVLVVDVFNERMPSKRIATGGPVMDIAMTPDGGKLFLAMSMKGLARLSVGSDRITQLSDRVCPVNLALDRQGRHLYVGFQCSAHPGHDDVQVFDAVTEVSLGTIAGMPMVASRASISPDGQMVFVSSGDACVSPQYDHQGCGQVPSIEFHLLFRPDWRNVQTYRYRVEDVNAVQFLDNSRLLMLGGSISILDTRRRTVVERFEMGEDRAYNAILAPDRRRAYVGSRQTNSILVLPLDAASVPNPKRGLEMLFAGDGTLDDSASINRLEPHGTIRFVPGRVGQSFFLGEGSLTLLSTGYFQAGRHDLSIALFTKFQELDGERIILDWTSENPSRGIRLLKTGDNQFAFQSWLEGSEIRSTTRVAVDTWYHIGITQSDRDVSLYVNGRPEATANTGSRYEAVNRPLTLGGYSTKHHSFRGWLDEIIFYNRVLSTDEIKSLSSFAASAARE